MISQELWIAYCTTQLEYTSEDLRKIHLKPTPGDSGVWPWGDDVLEVLIISAANPFSEKLSDEANLEHERMLKADLTLSGFKHVECQGQSPDGQWVEQSLMVIGAPIDVIKQFGEKYLQNAIFRWTPHSWECISLVSDQHFVTSWKLFS